MSEPTEPVKGDLVPLPTEQPYMGMSLSDAMTAPRHDYWCSMALDTPEDRMVVYRARNSDCFPMAEHFGKCLMVRGFVVHLWDDTDEKTGEVKKVVRTVLLCADGAFYAASSVGVRDSVRDLVTNFGMGPWEPPLPLVPKRGKTRAGYPVFKLDLDIAKYNELAEAKKKEATRAGKK